MAAAGCVFFPFSPVALGTGTVNALATIIIQEIINNVRVKLNNKILYVSVLLCFFFKFSSVSDYVLGKEYKKICICQMLF